jgi:hypothetical protein
MGVFIGVRSESYVATNRWLTLLSGADLDPTLAIEPPAPLHAPRQQREMAGHVNWRVEARE